MLLITTYSGKMDEAVQDKQRCGECEMDLESFAVTHSDMYDELLGIVEVVHSYEPIANERLSNFCQQLTDYLTSDVLSLQPPPPPQLINQALAFCKLYGKGATGDITKLKTRLGEIYEPLIKRLDAERAYLDKQLPNNQRLNKNTSHGFN